MKISRASSTIFSPMLQPTLLRHSQRSALLSIASMIMTPIGVSRHNYNLHKQPSSNIGFITTPTAVGRI